MKKSLKVSICGLMAAVLVSGCSAKTDSPAESTTAVQESGSEEAVSSLTLDPGEVVTLGQYTAEVAVKPEVTLGQYKGVSYTPVSQDVTDEEVEEQLTALVNANPTITEVDREAKNGDIVNIDYVGKKDGVAFDGGTASGYDLTLGSQTFIEGFEEGLVGVKAGQKLDLDLTFPEGYPSEDLAGQAVVFEVTVNKVQESVESELNDEFIKANTDFATVDEYRKALREDLEEMAGLNAEDQKMAEVLQTVVKSSEVNVSDQAVQAYYDEQYKSCEDMAQMYGVDTDTIITSFFGMTKEEFEPWLKEMSQEECKIRAVVEAIAQAENLVVEDKDREELAISNGFETVEDLIENAGEDMVNESALRMKVVQFIADNAVAES